MNNSLYIKIRYEMTLINQLIDNATPLLKTLKLRDPDFIELAALGTVLHSFYNGIENIFIMIEKNYGMLNIESHSWHKDLLKMIQKETSCRKPVISSGTAGLLTEYMMFRHFFRHAYGFQLDWKKMNNIAENMNDLWIIIQRELNSFMESMLLSS